jgi:hypothetical protein
MALNEQFENLNNALNTEFQVNNKDKMIQQIQDLKNQIQKLENNKSESSSDDNLKVKDENFLTKQLQELIINSRLMLTKLEEEIKVGSPPKMWEVYAKLQDSLSNQIKELRELNKLSTNLEIEKIKNKVTSWKNLQEGQKIALTPSQLSELVDNAKKNSQLNKIDTEFKIEEEDSK